MMLFVVGGLSILYSLLGFVAVSQISGLIEGLEGAGTLLAVLTVVFVLLMILGVLQIVAGARVLPLRRGVGGSWVSWPRRSRCSCGCWS